MEEPLPFGTPPPPQVRQLKMIVGFLMLGVVSFAGIVIAMPGLGGGSGGGTPPPSTLRMVLVLLGVTAIPMAFVMHSVQLRTPSDDERTRIAQFFTATIISNALVEGVALFAIVLFIMGRQPLDLIGAAVPVVLMAIAFFPTDGRWRAFAS